MEHQLQVRLGRRQCGPGLDAFSRQGAVHQHARAIELATGGQREDGLVGGRAEAQVIGVAKGGDGLASAAQAEARSS